MNLGPGSCGNSCLLWNYEAVLDVLHSQKNVVVAVFAGHEHRGGFREGETGISHVTFRSPLEAAPPLGSHAFVEVHEEAVVVHGYGWQGSHCLKF